MGDDDKHYDDKSNQDDNEGDYTTVYSALHLLKRHYAPRFLYFYTTLFLPAFVYSYHYHYIVYYKKKKNLHLSLDILRVLSLELKVTSQAIYTQWYTIISHITIHTE